MIVSRCNEGCKSALGIWDVYGTNKITVSRNCAICGVDISVDIRRYVVHFAGWIPYY